MGRENQHRLTGDQYHRVGQRLQSRGGRPGNDQGRLFDQDRSGEPVDRVDGKENGERRERQERQVPAPRVLVQPFPADHGAAGKRRKRQDRRESRERRADDRHSQEGRRARGKEDEGDRYQISKKAQRSASR